MDWDELPIGHLFTYYDDLLGSTNEEGFAGRGIKKSDTTYSLIEVRYSTDWQEFSFPKATYEWGAKYACEHIDIIDEGKYTGD